MEDSFAYRDLESAGAAPGEHRARPGQAADFGESPYAEVGPPGSAPAPSTAGQKSPITWPQAKHPTGGDGGARLLETAQPGDPLPLGYEWRGGFARAVPDAVDMVDEGADVRISRSIPAGAGPAPAPRYQQVDLPVTEGWRSMFGDSTYDKGFHFDDPVYGGGFLAPSPSPAADVAETESLRSLEVKPSQIDIEDLAEDLYAGGYRYGDPGVPQPPPGRPLEGLSEDLYVEIPPSRFVDPDAPPRLPPGKPTDLYPEIDDFARLRSGDPNAPPRLPPGRPTDWDDLPSAATKRSADGLDGSQPDVARWREPQSPGRATPQIGPDGARWGGDDASAGHHDIYDVLQRPGGDDASAGHHDVYDVLKRPSSDDASAGQHNVYGVLQRPGGDDASAGHHDVYDVLKRPSSDDASAGQHDIYDVLQMPSGDGASADNEGEHLYSALWGHERPSHTLEDPNAALPDDLYATPRGKVSRLDAHIADPSRQAPVKKETLSLHLASPHELEALELPADGSYFTANGRIVLQDGKAVPVEDGLPVIRISSALQEQIDQGLTTLQIRGTNRKMDLPSNYIFKVDPTLDPPPPQIPYDLEQFRDFARSRREQMIADWRQGALAGDAGGSGEDARAVLDGLPDGHRFEDGLPVAERAPMPMPNAPGYDEIAAKYLGANAGEPSRSLAPADAINPRGDAPTSVGNVEQVDVWPAPAGVDAHIDPDAGYATIDLADSDPPISLGELDPIDVPDGNQLANALAIDPHPFDAVDQAEVDRLADAWFDDALKAAGPDEPALKSIDDTRPHIQDEIPGPLPGRNIDNLQDEIPLPAPAPPLKDTSDIQGYWDDLLQARQQADVNFQRPTAESGANPKGLHLAAYDHLQLRRVELREQMLSLVLPHAEALGSTTDEILELDGSLRAYDVPFELRDAYLRAINLAEQAGDADKAEVMRHTLAAFDSMARLEVDAALARADELASFPGVPLPDHLDQERIVGQLQELIETAMGRMAADADDTSGADIQLASNQVGAYARAQGQVLEGHDPTPYLMEIIDRTTIFRGDGSAASKADSIESYNEVLRNVVSVLENPNNFTGPPAAVGTDTRSLLVAQRDEFLHAGKLNDALDTQRQINEIDKAGRISPGLEDSFVYRDLESAGAAPGEHRARPGQAADFDESPYAEIGPPGNAPAPSAAGQKPPIA